MPEGLRLTASSPQGFPAHPFRHPGDHAAAPTEYGTARNRSKPLERRGSGAVGDAIAVGGWRVGAFRAAPASPRDRGGPPSGVPTPPSLPSTMGGRSTGPCARGCGRWRRARPARRRRAGPAAGGGAARRGARIVAEQGLDGLAQPHRTADGRGALMGSDPLADLLVGRAARGARIFAVVQVASMGRAPRSRLGRRGGAGRAPRCCSASARRPAGRCGCRSPRPSGEGVLGEHAAGLMAPVDQGRMDLDLAPPARRGTAPRRRPCRPSAPRASPRAARAAAPPSGARRWARRRSARARPGPRARRPSPCRSSRPGHGRRPRDRAWRSARRDRSSDTALGGVRTTPAGPGAAQSRSARCSRTAREASSRGRSSALGTHRVWLASARTKRPSTATGSTDASPASRRRPTTRSKTARIRPPSRKRPRRFFVTVEWSGTRPSSPRRSEPPVGEVEPDPLAQPPLGADPMETAHQQHAHHPLGGDRGPARRAVVPRHAPARPGQLEHRVDPAGEVIRRHPLLEANLVRHSAARSTGRRIIAPLHPADPTGASEPCRLARAQGLLRRSRPVLDIGLATRPRERAQNAGSAPVPAFASAPAVQSPCDGRACRTPLR